MTCMDCGGTGELVLNSEWPSGDLPYSEKCSTCGGSGIEAEGPEGVVGPNPEGSGVS